MAPIPLELSGLENLVTLLARSQTSAYGGKRPLKECDISERVTNVAAMVALVYSTPLLSTNLEGKRLPSISLISIAAIVTSIGERHPWNVSDKTLAGSSECFSSHWAKGHLITCELGARSQVLTITHNIHGKG